MLLVEFLHGMDGRQLKEKVVLEGYLKDGLICHVWLGRKMMMIMMMTKLVIMQEIALNQRFLVTGNVVKVVYLCGGMF